MADGLATLSVVDDLLLEVAADIQLPPHLYTQAQERLVTVAEYLDRPESPLHGLDSVVHAQGSFSIGSTIKSLDEEDLFDIDLVVQFQRHIAETPHATLSLLHKAIRPDDRGRYKDAFRQSRCITIPYSGMHLDLTPLAWTNRNVERGGLIPHANPKRLAEQRFVHANPSGFSKWYLANAERQAWFEQSYFQRSMRTARVLLEQEIEPTPEQEDVYSKPMPTVGLQLLKRFVQIRYEKRDSRRPPSVLLAKWFAEPKTSSQSLLRDFSSRVLHVNQELRRLPRDIYNPAYDGYDNLTDRWPENALDIQIFQSDIRDLLARLERLDDEMRLTDIRNQLAELFGESLSERVLKRYATFKQSAVSSQTAGISRSTGRVAPTVWAGASAPETITAAKRRDWGSPGGDDTVD